MQPNAPIRQGNPRNIVQGIKTGREVRTIVGMIRCAFLDLASFLGNISSIYSSTDVTGHQ